MALHGMPRAHEIRHHAGASHGKMLRIMRREEPTRQVNHSTQSGSEREFSLWERDACTYTRREEEAPNRKRPMLPHMNTTKRNN